MQRISGNNKITSSPTQKFWLPRIDHSFCIQDYESNQPLLRSLFNVANFDIKLYLSHYMDMNNSVTLNPKGYIEICLVNDQTAESFNDIYHQSLPLISRIKSEGRPLLGFIDGSRQTGFSLSSDKAALKFLEEVEYDRIAMYNIPHAEVTKGIILAIGKADNTKLFNDKNEALKWLMGE
jgi:hypothetical protein